MPRLLLCWAALAGCALPAGADEKDPPPETLLRLTVSPTPGPKPALRYLLLPELREMTPGNPIPNYLKCFMEQDFSAEQETLGRSALRQADRAARMDRPDWLILQKAKTDGVSLLLPDVQKMRQLINGLRDRCHEEVTQRRFDDAVGTFKTMFAMARHMGDHPTLIGDLVGIAMATVAIGPLEEMIEQPGCPNLYWALTNLPHPFLSVDRGNEGERLLITGEMSDLDDQNPMSFVQISKVITHVERLREMEPKPDGKQTTREWINARVKDRALVEAARRRLVEAGLPEERVRRFPAEQVILLDEKREYETRRDEVMKIMPLATWEVEALYDQVKPPAEPRLFDIFVPALIKVRRAQGRLEQRLALLQHVEALRLYAATHAGRWPKSLADAGVPLPPDPFTGKPFRYEVVGEVAHLRGTPPRGEEKNAALNLHYELTLRK